MSSPWVCYLLRSLSCQRTYVGTTNNVEKRLKKHNTGRGAKYTRANGPWIPVLVLSGFPNKVSCLSFEKGWQKLAKKRSNNRLLAINISAGLNLSYLKDPVWNRLLDLLYFTYYSTFINGKFNRNCYLQLSDDIHIIIDIFCGDGIENLPWSYVISCQQ